MEITKEEYESLIRRMRILDLNYERMELMLKELEYRVEKLEHRRCSKCGIES